jgi:hypothetical protein
MSIANPLWGAPRIHGELLKLGIDVGQTSVAVMDLFVAPTVSFRLLYGLLIMGHGRRQILWLGVTAHRTAEWIANQLMWLRATPSLSDPRSGCLLRRHIYPTRSFAWHSRSSDFSTLTLAERICGAFDRLNPQGMPRPCCCGRRATPAPHPHVLHGVLQRSPNASLSRQGCAGSKDRSARGAHRSAACPWRPAPSIRTDLIFGIRRGLVRGGHPAGRRPLS